MATDPFASKLHRDGTVSIWSVYENRWIRSRKVSSAELASMNAKERTRVMRHLARHRNPSRRSAVAHRFTPAQMKAMIRQYRQFPWQYSLDRAGWEKSYGQAFVDLLETYISAGPAAYHTLRKALFPAIGEPNAHGVHGLTGHEKHIVDTMIRDFATDPGWWSVKANPRRRTARRRSR